MNFQLREPLEIKLQKQIERFLPEGAAKQKALRWITPRAQKAIARMRRRQDIKSSPARYALEKLRSEKKGARGRADAAFSIFIRTRDTKPGEDGVRRGLCCTCGQEKTFAELQNGHWQKRGFWGTRYHPLNCHAQCAYCNDKRYGNGKEQQHEQYIMRKHGPNAPDFLRVRTKTQSRKPPTSAFLGMIKKFKADTAALLENEQIPYTIPTN